MEDGEMLQTWEVYFPKEDYTIYNKEIHLIMEIRKELSKENTDYFREIKEKRIFECDYDFYKKFEAPASSLKCFSCAVSEIIYILFNEMVFIDIKIINHNEITNFSDIKVGNLVSLMGTCCRVGFKKIENLEAYFQCSSCNATVSTVIKDNIYRNPKCNCKGKTFIFLPNHPEMKCIDKQEIKIQEYNVKMNDHIEDNENLGAFSSSNLNEKDNISRKIIANNIIDVDLYGSLVGSAAPGDLIKVTGVVVAELCTDAYKLKIQCNNIIVVKNKIGVSTNNCDTDFQLFKKISQEKDLMELLSKTLFPNIYGHNLIKIGIILSLFGGTKKFVGNNLVRSEIHILIIGDPGLGKSKLLLIASKILPKSIYISGNFCTSSGLTVSITHDPNTGEYMADAGALVVSDGGVCCIDEFDKIDDHTSLFEAMEDQKVTVAKGGMCCSVSARSTVIAASNPRHGHFDARKSIRDNIKFDTALLSRFDLVHILLDNLTEEENYKISNKILKKRLIDSSICEAESENEYDVDLLRKYIEYARSSVYPVLSKAAKQKIKEYYIDIRNNKGVSIRNLESLIRLTEAYAKVELKPVASIQHAQQAINLYKKLLIKDERSDKKKGIEDLLRDFINENETTIISKTHLLDLIKESKSNKSEIEMIEILNFKGIIIKKGKDDYKIVL